MDRYEKLETHMDPDRVRIELDRHDFLGRNRLELNRYELLRPTSISNFWTRSRSRSKKFFMSIQLHSISIQEAFHVGLAQNFHTDPARSKEIFMSVQLKSMRIYTKNSRTQHWIEIDGLRSFRTCRAGPRVWDVISCVIRSCRA